MNSSNLIIREATYCMILYDYKWFLIEHSGSYMIYDIYDNAGLLFEKVYCEIENNHN